jgi:ankyrin repeat protein
MDTIVVEESTGPDVQLTDSRVAAAVHSIALLQRELANLTSHIEISQAINSKTGPYANIRRGVENIGQRLNYEEQQLIEEASGSKVSTEVESGSSDGEECPDCHQIFPWQIIFFHEENCKQEGSVPYNLLDDDGDANTVVSKSHLALPQSNKTKEVPRAQTRSILFKLFKSNTELHRAAKKGDAKKIKALLDLGVDINYEGSSGCTALHLATDYSHEAAVRVLLDNGADPQAKSSEGRTPLHSAARTSHTTIVRLLLEKDVDVIAKDPSGSTALHIAAYNGQELVVQILLEKYPFVEVRGPSGFTALHIAAFNGQLAVVRLLVEMRADLEARSDTGRTALQLAAEKGHEAVVRHLLQHGANIMAKDSIGRTALQGAVSNQHGGVAQLLLDKVVPELDAIESPTWSRQLSNAPRYDSSVG